MNVKWMINRSVTCSGALKNKNLHLLHFCEEFVFIPEDDSEWQRYHEKDYLNIAQFNAMYFANEDDDDSQLPNYGY